MDRQGGAEGAYQRLEAFRIADEDDVDPAPMSQDGSLDDLVRGLIATHRVDGDAGHGDQLSATTSRPL